MKRLILIGFVIVSLFPATSCKLMGISKKAKATSAKTEENEKKDEKDEEKTKIKPYEEVITDKAVSDEGIFTVHRIKDKIYYEIPTSELGKEFLWVTQIAQTTLGAGYGGTPVGNRVVKWERREEKILLRNISHDIVAAAELPIARAVKAANTDAIIMAFDIAALGEEEAPVIDVTGLFTSEVAEFSPKKRLKAGGFDAKRSFIERAISFPRNIEVDAIQTYKGGSEPGRGGSATVVMHFSMVKLPEEPMKPRLHDSRVGYFSIRQMDYGREDHRATERRYITRWRLEKKLPDAKLSEPVKPIVYWIDPATPAKWVPYVKSGIEAWQTAFEEAGFKNAIVARDAPSAEEDPNWSPEDSRNSVVRWLPSTIQNAMGPHVNDPRTGEILNADIQMYHNILNLQRTWYFTQASPLDPRAQKLPLPDDLMGKLLEFVVTHEVGHTLGLPHNMKASSLYPADKVRDPEWVKKMGHTPTLMDYSRFNYVAQPEDGIDVDDLIPKVGPYDKFSIMWGYTPIPDAKTPDEEKPTLDGWSRRQDDTPWLRFSTQGSNGSDPGELTEAVGDADAVASTALGIKNLKRVAGFLLDATTTQTGEPYDDLEELYGHLISQWVRELNHVAQIVGGFDTREKHVGQEGIRFVPITKERQSEAVRFLNENAFATPKFLLDPEILRRIEPTGAIDRIGRSQRRVLASLLSSSRLNRLVEQATFDRSGAYQPTEFLADVRGGIWSELDRSSVEIDAFRRGLQRAYLGMMASKIGTGPPGMDDSRAFVRGELTALRQSIKKALPQAADDTSRLHLQDILDRIAKALDPRLVLTGADTSTAAQTRATVPEVWDELVCWPDYLADEWMDGEF